MLPSDVLADTAGMVCDLGYGSCAQGRTGVEAYTAALLAMNGRVIQIPELSMILEKTVENIAQLSSEGMRVPTE